MFEHDKLGPVSRLQIEFERRTLYKKIREEADIKSREKMASIYFFEEAFISFEQEGKCGRKMHTISKSQTYIYYHPRLSLQSLAWFNIIHVC